MATVANNDIKNGHNNQQTMRANNYEKMEFDGGSGQGQRWWRWCLMAAAMDNNKVVARRQRQERGHNNQMKMTFDSSSGRGRSMAATIENGKVAECSTGAVTDDDKATARQDLEAATEQEQETDAMLEDKIIGGGTRGWESEANKPNGGRGASHSHSLVFLPVVLRRGIQQPAREQEGYGKRGWWCVRVLEVGASKKQEDVTACAW
jgi:hypothetical protein